MLMKDRCAFLKKHDYIDLFDVSVRERFCLSPDPHVLTHNQICRITGDALCRKGVALLLNLYIAQGPVRSLSQQVHDQTALSVYHPVFARQNTQDLHFKAKQTGNKTGKPVSMYLRIKKILEKRIICKRKRLFSDTKIKKPLIMVI